MKKDIDIKVAVILIISIALLVIVSAWLSNAPKIAFNYASGFYEEPLQLQIICRIPGAKTYYTCDGSIPDTTDLLYTGTLNLSYTADTPNHLSAITGTSYNEYIPVENVMKAHIIRAIAITPWGTQSEIINGTFFIGYNREEEFGSVPIISLMIEQDDFFDYERGIYVNGKTFDDWRVQQTESFESWEVYGNYSNTGREWERACTVEFLPSDGSDGFVQNMGIRIKGAVSRTYQQKSLRLIARAEYGKKALEYPILPKNERLDGKGNVEKYKSIVLRNGGNDVNWAKIRDPYIQNLARGLRFITQMNAPCIVFINGEYWGMYTITEEYSDNFIENNLGIDNHNVISVKTGIIEDGEEEDIDLYKEMISFIINNDMTNETNYRIASEMLDIGSYADYCALQFYICNIDGIFDKNNWQMWRVRVPNVDDSIYNDGKWRMMLFDADYSAGIADNTEQFSYDMLTPILFSNNDIEDYSHTAVIRALWNNDNFKQELILAMCDIRNIYFEKTRTTRVLNEMRIVYEPLIIDTYIRFGPEWIIKNVEAYVQKQLDDLGEFFSKRYDVFLQIVQNALGLSEPCLISINNSDYTKGTVMLNHSELELDEGFTGMYFCEYPITLTAIAAEESAFTGWIIEGDNIAYSTAPSIEVYVNQGMQITAVFE